MAASGDTRIERAAAVLDTYAESDESSHLVATKMLEAADLNADRRTYSGAIALENAGIVSVGFDVGPAGIKILLTKEEAYQLSGELNAAALALDHAEEGTDEVEMTGSGPYGV